MKGDPVTRRVRHWARWRSRRLGDVWRRSTRLDVLSDESRATWICGWQRSGSTLLAEVLATAPGTRLIYEPANLPDRLFAGEDAARVPLPTSPGPALSSIERALRGRVHGAWVDQLADGHLVRRRVVKDVRGTGLLAVVAARHPTTPIVVLVRHPIAVARSAVELGWTATADDPDELMLAEVRRWSAMHATALRAPPSHRALVVTYEHLVLDRDAVLDAVLAHLAAHHATWRGLAIDPARLDAPSATSFRRPGVSAREAWVEPFDDVSARVRDGAVAVLRDAGLGALYGADPTPLVGPRDVAAAIRGT